MASRVVVLACFGWFQAANGFDRLPDPPPCFTGGFPGTKDRSSQSIRLAYRNWVSHDISTYVTYYILKELLRYDASVVDGSSASTSQWGPHMVAGEYDADMESWQIGNQAYRDYITRDAVVMDFGPIGYPGRAGIFLTNAAPALAANKFADYYITYEDAAKAIAIGAQTFGELDGPSILAASGSSWPVCAADWCGSGALEGYWVPPQCAGVESDPSKCVEVIMMKSSWDSGYFEQLTTNFGLKFVHGYYGDAHNDLIKAQVAANKQSLFYWYTPDPLITGSRSARVSFPDFYVGCNKANTNRPDGPLSCDYPELNMAKLGHARIKELPEAMYFLQRMELLTADIEGIMTNHTATGGPYNAPQAACAWVQSYANKVQEFAPDCIVKPPTNPQTGDLIFDKDKLECVQTTVYPLFTPPPQCVDDADMGTKDRRAITVKVGVRNWLSHSLSAYVAGIVLQDILRYKVEFVDLSTSTTANWGLELTAELFHLDPENWQSAPDSARYKQFIKEQKTVVDLGEIGYGGRGAIFVLGQTVAQEPSSGYYKYFEDPSAALALGYPRFNETDLREFIATEGGGPFPVCNPSVISWCPIGTFEGYWAPPQCQASPADCVEVYMASPTYDTAYFEQLSRNLNLGFIHAYAGWSLPTLIKARHAQNKPSAWYWWEPDPLPTQVSAQRLSFPDFSYGCDRSNDRNADTGGLACDYPETKLRKVGAAGLATAAPEAYFALSNLLVLKPLIEEMMLATPDGGGSLTVAQSACATIRGHLDELRSAFPTCIAKPTALDSIRIGDEVFDPDQFVCKAMSCPLDAILRVDQGRIFCQECPAGLVPNADQTECSLCSKGTSVNANRTSCSACAAGSFAENRGQTQCDLCPKGTFIASTGQTACQLCDKGLWQDQLGSTGCKACTDGTTTDSRGMFTEDSCQCPLGEFENAAGSCSVCPEGMTCPFGSKVANIQSGDMSLPMPRVDPGYFTLASEPLSVYLCKGTDTERCPGGLPSSCSGGLQSLVCEECPAGEALKDGVCTKCDAGPSVGIFVGLPVGLCVLAFVMFKVANDKVTVNVGIPLMVSVLLGLVVTTVQTVALFPGLSLEWRAQGDLFGSFKFFLGSPDTIPLACALSGSPVVMYAFRCMLPVLCVVVVWLVYGITVMVNKSFFHREGWSVNIAINTMGQLLQTLFIAIAVLVVQPMRCYGHPNGKSSTTSFPQVLCWEDGDHGTLVALGVLVGVLFIFPFLAYCVDAVRRAPKAKDAITHYQRWRFLLYRFRSDVWWWGIVFLFRQMALAFSTCIPADSPQWQITYVATVAALYLVVVCAKWPWKNSMLNYIDVGSMLTVLLIIVSSGGFVSSNAEDVQSFVIFHFIVFFSFTVFIVYVLGTAAYWAKYRGFRGAYGSERSVDVTAKAWTEFIQVSASIDANLLKSCIKTFTEFDVQVLVKAMGSFQSVDATFGDRLAPRLKSISHSSSNIDGIASAVKAASQQSLGAPKKGDINNVSFVVI